MLFEYIWEKVWHSKYIREGWTDYLEVEYKRAFIRSDDLLWYQQNQGVGRS